MPREDLPFCDCRWLERAAHDPDNPIEFDPQLNEYNLKTPRGHSLRIYHCPFCAGRAPDSLRGQMFAEVPSEESWRLHNLIKDLKTEEDVIAALGKPTHVMEPGAIHTEPDKDDKAGEIRTFKTLRFESLSDTAVVDANIDRRGNASISIFGKYIGKPPKT
jgi:hypothetical protein